MFADNSLAFSSNWSTPQAITATANSTNVIDITGAGSGNAPSMIGGNGGTLGEDYGLGDGVTTPYLYLTVSTAGTGSGTLTVLIEAAPDNGSNAPGTWSQLYESTAFVGTSLTGGSVLLVPLPPRLPGEALPRFYRLVYTVSGTLTVSVLSGLVLNPPSALTGGQYPNNFLAA